MGLEILPGWCLRIRRFSAVCCFVLPTFSYASSGIPILSAEEFQKVYSGKESQQTAHRLNQILGFTMKKTRVPSNAVRFPYRDPARVEARALSVSAFNVEQGRRIDQILHGIGTRKKRSASLQSELLWNSDVLILNESDWGTCRSQFRNVADEIGAHLGYDHVFGTEFIEVQPARIGLVPGQGTKDCPNPKFQANAPQVTGNAILSRFPIHSVSRINLPACHDWFLEQRDGAIQLEERQTRRGGRMALIASIDLPGGGDNDLTAVSVHLENKSWPGCRQKQLEFLLRALSEIKGPMIVGGDLNTWGTSYVEKSFFESAVRAGFSWEANDNRPTYSLAGLPLRLDYLLFRKGDGLHKTTAMTLSSINSPLRVSDHDPIYSRFQLIPK